jgi:hypothetical protein
MKFMNSKHSEQFWKSLHLSGQILVCEHNLKNDIVTCRMVHVTKVTGSSSNDWIYWQVLC